MEEWRLGAYAFILGLVPRVHNGLRGIQGLLQWRVNALQVIIGDDVRVRVRTRCCQVCRWRWEGRNVDASQLGARWLTHSGKYMVTRAVTDRDVLSINKSSAASIAQFSQTDEVVSESRDDTAGACCHAG